MRNRIIIGIMVLVVLFMGGFGYYAYTLNQHIDRLDSQLADFKTEQAARLDAVSSNLTAFRTETSSSLDTLSGKVSSATSQIGTLQKEADASQAQLGSLETALNGVSANVSDMAQRLKDVTGSAMDASQLYAAVSPATVMITNVQDQGTSLGSGVIFDNAGHVLTAYHVVEGATSDIYVTLHDGRVIPATVLGSNAYSDVAVLQLATNPGIKPVPLGDSSQVKVGDPVLVIGNPGAASSAEDTTTTGIISQVNRYIDYGVGGVSSLLQFDAAVNPGNSGGGLFNAAGEVIGIVVAAIDASSGSGIYWAVDANKAKRVAAAIIDHGSFAYPVLGVSITDLTPQTVVQMGLDSASGALVAAVTASSPAQAAGIQTDDVIVAIDGVAVRDTGSLTSYLGENKSPGDTVTIRLIRSGTTMNVSVILGTR